MRTLLAISAIAALTMSSAGVAFADPSDPEDPSESGCISTGCKDVYKPEDVKPGDLGDTSKDPKPAICMDTIGDGTGPQFDGCVLPGGPVSPGG